MTDLIRRDDAIQAFDELLKSPYASNKDPFGCGVRDALKLARDMMRSDAPKSLSIPAVDAVEVVHGHWITEKEAMERDDYLLMDTCSVCGHCDWDCTESENFNFCPNCGAKMDGEDGDGDGE